MRELPRIALDAMGGDHAPRAAIDGALEAVRDLPVRVSLVGPTALIEQELARAAKGSRGAGASSITIVDAPEAIAMAEHPVAAVRTKRRSSIVVGLDLVAQAEAAGFVTAGNTGAAMTAALLGLKRIEGIDRPALAIPFPTSKGRPALLLDIGANADARPHNLVQFAVMGSVYAERVLGIASPRVALLSIGEEDEKGSLLVQDAHRQLRSAPVRFIGNVEGKDIPSGDADVIVTDGFVGNVLIKFAEGVGGAMTTAIRTEIRANIFTSLLGLAMMPVFRRVNRRLDYAEYGGAPLLGVNGVCIVAHGRSNPRAIRNAIRVAAEAAQGGLVERIRDGLIALQLDAATSG
jgi:glycerol-3-phosphate acyltransferase PlsX